MPGLQPNKTLGQEELAAISQGVKDGADVVDQALEKLATRKNGWDLDATFGQRGVDPARQAARVLRGLDWPFASEGLVYIARVDDGDRVLSGAHDYATSLRQGELPPANAFWSVTMYSARTATLVPGAKRAWLTDQTAKKNARRIDRSILSADAPAKNESNWLPEPKGEAFIVVLRVYQPATARLRGGAARVEVGVRGDEVAAFDEAARGEVCADEIARAACTDCDDDGVIAATSSCATTGTPRRTCPIFSGRRRRTAPHEDRALRARARVAFPWDLRPTCRSV